MAPDLIDELDAETIALWQQLIKLQQALRQKTKTKFQRINPFYEDLFNWQEKGQFCTNQENVTIYNSATIIGNVTIGDHTWIGPFSTLDGGGGLEIGRYCSIAQGCQLLSHDSVKWALSGGKKQYDYAKTKIGDNCFLGAYVVVLKGIEIGSHSVIAAGAVVNKNVPENSIIAGVPGKRIGQVILKENGEIEFDYFKAA